MSMWGSGERVGRGGEGREEGGGRGAKKKRFIRGGGGGYANSGEGEDLRA